MPVPAGKERVSVVGVVAQLRGAEVTAAVFGVGQPTTRNTFPFRHFDVTWIARSPGAAPLQIPKMTWLSHPPA